MKHIAEVDLLRAITLLTAVETVLVTNNVPAHSPEYVYDELTAVQQALVRIMLDRENES
jgi:hypothetical protein